MEVVQGKSTDQKVVIAQEIAFAKVLAGNNKTLRDKALRKLKRWLTIRGNGKWAFEESEFIRISTGLFYCMWMSDKYLVQEELAESISQLIHCFEKNSEGALLFIKCFFKRLLMEWEGLDQYRIDKFNMLVRRFLRQSLVYCKRRKWDQAILSELMKIFYLVVLHKDNCLGFVLHFISIYAEEIAKVSKGKLKNETVLALIEPIVKVMAKSKDERIQQEISLFFDHIIRQTDVGLEFEDRFNAWKQQGFPGTGPECMKREVVGKKKNVPVENENEEDFENDDDGDDEEERLDEALDPRAGSVDVFLPQIPIDPDAIIALLKKYENSPQTIPTGKKKLRTWIHKLYAIKKGRFPAKFKKDLILEQKNKRRSALKKAKTLLEFTESLYDGPVRTKELQAISKELESDEEDEKEEGMASEEEEDMVSDEEEEEIVSDEEKEEEEIATNEEEEDMVSDEDEEMSAEEEGEEKGEEEVDDDEENEEEDLEEDDKPNAQVVDKTKTENKKVVNGLKDGEQVSLQNGKKAKKGKVKDNKRKCLINPYAEKAVAKMAEEGESLPEDILTRMKENKKQLKKALKNHKKLLKDKIAEEVEKESKKVTKEVNTVVNGEVEPKKKRIKLVTISKETGVKNDEGTEVPRTGEDGSEGCDSPHIVTPVKRRKILSSWQVQELDTSSPDYYQIKIPKTIKLEKKTREGWEAEENQEPEQTNKNSGDVESEVGSKVKEDFTPVFWEKAKAKAAKKMSKLKSKDLLVNPYALVNNESKSPGLRRISFALDRNMAQENDEYLEEVRNSPKVPFDGSKKPSQGVLKSGLSPSPVNPFYRFKRIKC